MKNVKHYFPIIWYYVGWFGSVYSGKYGLSKWSLFFPVFLVSILIAWKKLSFKLTAFLAFMATLGVCFDAVMAANGAILFSDADYSILPLWLISIWFLFVFVIPIMVPLFYSRLWLAAVLGLILGPLSYASGSAMGVLSFADDKAASLYAAFWGLYFPLSVYAVGKFFLVRHKVDVPEIKNSL